MATLYNVRVRPDYRWPKARVGGREFSKAIEVMNEAYLTEEMLTSPLLEIVELPNAEAESEEDAEEEPVTPEETPETDEDGDG